MFVDALSAEPYARSALKLIAATGLSCSPAYPDYLTGSGARKRPFLR